jgi:hypothetical protein
MYGLVPLWSFAYDASPIHSCLTLLEQEARNALSLACFIAGSSSAARIAMMATTTNNSMSVNPPVQRPFLFEWDKQVLIINMDMNFS